MPDKYLRHKNLYLSNTNSETIRNVPIGLQFGIFFSGTLMFVGVMFFIIGTFVFIPFATQISFKGLQLHQNSPTTEGTVTNISPTNSTSNHRTIYRYDYEFTDNKGTKHTGASYMPQDDEDLKQVTIQYSENNPNISRIQGLSTGAFPAAIIIVILIFPVTGFLMMFFRAKKNIVYIQLVKIGKVSLGKYSRMEATNVSVNNQPVMRVYVKFKAEDGSEHEATGESYRVSLLTDEDWEPLIYNPLNPDEAVMIDSLPKGVRSFLQSEIEVKKNISNN